LEPGSHAYNVPSALRLKGALNVSALQKAIDEIVQRHEPLRTTFRYEDGKLAQNISPKLAIGIEMIDLGEELTELNKQERALELVDAVAQKPFDLARGPLIRATLLRLAADEHILVIVMHHTVCDGWSQAIFFRELQACYEAFAEKRNAPEVPELPVRFADYAHWRRKSMQGAALEEELTYWKEKLAGAPTVLELPTDRPEAEHATHEAATKTVQLSPEQTSGLMEFGQRESATPFIIMMAAVAITLQKWSRQNDLVVGTVVSGRHRRELENLIGCFMNFLPIRTRIKEGETVQNVLTTVRSAVLEAQAHQGCPFEKMVEAINPERKLHQNPLYNVAFLFQNFPQQLPELRGIDVSPVPVTMKAALLDLRFEANQTPAGLSLSCEYKTQLFDSNTIDLLLAGFQKVLNEILKEPATSLDEIAIPSELAAQSKSAAERHGKEKIAVAATFTAEPIEESLRYWLNELGIRGTVEFAPYNQVFQQLLDPTSLFNKNERGLNVLLVRLEDWAHVRADERGEWQANLQSSCHEFVGSLKTAMARISVPCLVCVCPSRRGEDGRAEFLARMESQLREEIEALSGVYVVASDELSGWYPVADYEDTGANELGHVPYTPVFFAALGTVVARKFHAINRRPHKVIVLDCDQTLWSGVCGEDGPKGIRLDEPRRKLQEFMRAQHAAGMLLALCSKNNEEDVWEVFAHRLDMPLCREHFAAWRLNWRPKSENLKALAEELKLGLDSFIFIDDNPVECAEVQANCAEVLTLELPQDPGSIDRFLNHCWAFDRLKVTEEDRRRGEMYQQNQQRESLRAQSMSLGDFIAGLELQIEIQGVATTQLARVAQLTQRTNQFNFTTRRRGESDLKMLTQAGHGRFSGQDAKGSGAEQHAPDAGGGVTEILAVSVRDKFGDYGLTGAIIYEYRNDSLEVDTFLLSCRVLGRGVEHRMLARLGEMARERGLNWVDVHFTPSAKNKPALDFLESIAASFRHPQNGGYVFRIPSGFAAEITFNAVEVSSVECRGKDAASAAPSSGKRENSTGGGIAQRLDNPPSLLAPSVSAPFPYRRIALEADDAFKIHDAIERRVALRERRSGGYAAPRTELEQKLCELWQKLLHIDRVGIADNFFELGGHSLLAVRLFAEIDKLIGRKFPLVTLFQAPTIQELAHVMSEAGASSTSLLVPLQPHGSKPPLWLIHGAGGDVLWGYANLAAHLPADQPLYGIKSRGQVGMEEFTRLEEMAEYYLQEIRAFQPQGPYLLGGYCFGGNVAYEIARQLLAQGEKVSFLALIDAAPANAGYESIPWWRPSYVYRFARNAYLWLRDFEQVPPEERRRFVWRKVRALNRRFLRRLWPQLGLEPVDLEDVIDTSKVPEKEQKLWEIHLRSLVEHVQQPYDGAVTLLRTRGQAMFCSLADDFCWGGLARGGVTITCIPGSHENIFMEPHVKCLAKELEACLSQATGHPSHSHALVAPKSDEGGSGITHQSGSSTPISKSL
jgi:FkbH-like protein